MRRARRRHGPDIAFTFADVERQQGLAGRSAARVAASVAGWDVPGWHSRESARRSPCAAHRARSWQPRCPAAGLPEPAATVRPVAPQATGSAAPRGRSGDAGHPAPWRAMAESSASAEAPPSLAAVCAAAAVSARWTMLPRAMSACGRLRQPPPHHPLWRAPVARLRARRPGSAACAAIRFPTPRRRAPAPAGRHARLEQLTGTSGVTLIDAPP